MRRISWYAVIAIALAVMSVGLYAVQIAVFHRTADTLFYLLQDIAFLPIEVLLVTVVLNRLLQMRENRELQEKMGMVIGIFFTEMGNTLLRYFSEFDVNITQMRQTARIRSGWSHREFVAIRRRLLEHEYTIDCQCADLNDLNKMLDEKREFLLQLLSNPSLLEHASFTEMLWAVSHLTQELDLRPELDDLPDSDYAHIATDMRRAYVQMVVEWLAYVRQIENSHPYMFSLIVRMNPFDPNPSPIIKQNS
jgi:hypothetical protein